MNKIDVLMSTFVNVWASDERDVEHTKTPRAPCRDRAKKRKRGRVRRMSGRVNRSR